MTTSGGTWSLLTPHVISISPFKYSHLDPGLSNLLHPLLFPWSWRGLSPNSPTFMVNNTLERNSIGYGKTPRENLPSGLEREEFILFRRPLSKWLTYCSSIRPTLSLLVNYKRIHSWTSRSYNKSCKSFL